MAAPRERPGPVRLAVGFLAVGGMMPYLVLKGKWLAGNQVGSPDPEAMSDATLGVLNVATLGMEAVAVLAAAALTSRWGARLPAWLLVFPIWVAAGLLGPRVGMMPLSWAMSVSANPTEHGGSDLIEPWVYVMVSASFAVQGCALLAAFALYCRARWGRLLLRPMGDVPPARTHGFQVVAVRACCAMATVIAAMALGGVWLAEETARGPVLLGAVSQVTWMIPAMAGALLLVRAFGTRSPLWLALALVGAGTGAMVWWGSWSQITILAPSAISSGARVPLVDVAGFGGVCIGVALAMVAAFVVAERARSDR
jgi:hypothetical protein